MYYEVTDVQLELPRGEIISAKFLIWEEAPEDSELVKVSLQFNSREITITDHDYFAALCSIRRVLELEGGLLHCYGASRNVYPSPMSRDMGGGLKAFKMHLGSHAKLSDLVSIFDSGADMCPTTVDEQERFYKEWLASFGDRRRGQAQSLVCCRNFADAGFKRASITVIMLDYYDGPTGGLMKCEVCSEVYKFTMVDWDNKIRIHALAPMPSDSFKRLEEIKAKHDPKWWPAGPEIDEILVTAQDTTMVAAFSPSGDTVIAAKHLAKSDLRYVQEWLSLTDPRTARDWFSFLGLIRNCEMA